MSDGLFDIPPSYPPRLLLASKRMDAAQAAFDEATKSDEQYDGFGIIPNDIKDELSQARYELSAAEYTALKQTKHP